MHTIKYNKFLQMAMQNARENDTPMIVGTALAV